jgi:c-di-GMP-binding flagellar brake protein YcgR
VAGVQFLELDAFGEQLLSRHIIRLQAEDRRKRLIEDTYGDYH